MGILQSKKIVSEGVECIAIRLTLQQAKIVKDMVQNPFISEETQEQYEFREKLYYSLRDTLNPELKNSSDSDTEGVVPF